MNYQYFSLFLDLFINLSISNSIRYYYINYISAIFNNSIHNNMVWNNSQMMSKLIILLRKET